MKVTVKLPIPRDADIVVDIGDKISRDTHYAEMPAKNTEKTIHLSRLLKIPPKDIQKYLLVRVGEKIHLEEIIAQKKSFFKTSFIRSPVEGKITQIDFKKGIMIIDNAKEDDARGEVRSPVAGKIIKINQNDLELELDGMLLDVLDAAGNDVIGEIMSIDKNVDTFDLSSDAEEKIILCEGITESALTKAEVIKAKGLILSRPSMETHLSWVKVDTDIYKKIVQYTGKQVWLRIDLKQLVILD